MDCEDPASLATGDEEALTTSARKRRLGVTMQYATAYGLAQPLPAEVFSMSLKPSHWN